jgi:hypothetical protein
MVKKKRNFYKKFNSMQMMFYIFWAYLISGSEPGEAGAAGAGPDPPWPRAEFKFLSMDTLEPH